MKIHNRHIAFFRICTTIILILLYTNIACAQHITTFAGNGNVGFSGEGGPAINAEFSFLAGVAADKWGNIYLADLDNSVIQKIDSNGILTRFAGRTIPGSGGDGGPATAANLSLDVVVGIAIDSVGNVFFPSNSTIKKVNTSGIISTFAGTGVYGYSGDGGQATAAQFEAPTGLCFDHSGNLFIADELASVVRMINSAGIISTAVGTTIGSSGDGGPASAAQIKEPDGLAFDSKGNLYITEAQTVRMVDTAKVISTFAGDPSGTSPRFCIGCPSHNIDISPIGLAVDVSDNLYISCIGQNVVDKITQSSLGYTVAGSGASGYSGDGGPATSARLYFPTMICMDKGGNLYIADKGNKRIRKVWIGTENTPVLQKTDQFTVFPNPAHNAFICSYTTTATVQANIIVENTLGQQVYSNAFITNHPKQINLNAPPGIYFITATAGGHQAKTKIVLE